MNKQDLVNYVSDETSLTKADCEKIINTMLEGIKKNLKKEDITLVGFGTFTKSKRKARNGRNPQTGHEIRIPACTVPKFRAGKALKDVIR